ncbi:MAG: hypothetical protein QM638_01275 [Nocardioides sp.]|uniref:hypothetical protein n=1 Tax=Nocardioides sp. TaxID=35761 RepID=UPI0039E44A90
MIATQSPYWLRLNGLWVHLEGVTPGVDVAMARPSSSFISTDGYQIWQRAPRGPRSWELNYTYATPDAIAALQAAAAGVGGSTDTLLLDTTMSAQNMLAPEDCWGDGAAGWALGAGVYIDGIPLDTGVSWEISCRADTTYFFGVVTDHSVGTTVGSITDTDGDTDVTLTRQSGNPGVSASFTTLADTTITVTLAAAAGKTAWGPIFAETATTPTAFVIGQGTPCPVAIVDPDITVNRAWYGGNTAGETSWADYSVTIQEVAAQ